MVHIPEFSGNAAHWDLPGGRVDRGEVFSETLQRELNEELGVTYEGTPKQLVTLLTKITISVGGTRVPLIFVIYEVDLPETTKITLDPESNEDAYTWFTPREAAKEMEFKFTTEFCELIRRLPNTK